MSRILIIHYTDMKIKICFLSLILDIYGYTCIHNIIYI